jgi:hypothetical protein
MTVAPTMLTAALAKAVESFAQGELAYLALTSKPELALRDRLAWVLHGEFPDLVIAREWKAPSAPGRDRTDLAVLDASGGRALALLEATAGYSFDFAGPDRHTVREYTDKVAGDLDKARLAAGEQAVARYALMLLTHPCGVPARLPGVIKYLDRIERAVRRRTAQDLWALAEHTATTTLRVFGAVHSGCLPAGRAFDVEVQIGYWLIGPV